MYIPTEYYFQARLQFVLHVGMSVEGLIQLPDTATYQTV